MYFFCRSNGAYCYVHELRWKRKIETSKNELSRQDTPKEWRRVEACSYELHNDIGYFTNPDSRRRELCWFLLL